MAVSAAERRTRAGCSTGDAGQGARPNPALAAGACTASGTRVTREAGVLPPLRRNLSSRTYEGDPPKWNLLTKSGAFILTGLNFSRRQSTFRVMEGTCPNVFFPQL